MNRIVARFADGRVVKGMTADFSPGKDVFHVFVTNAPSESEPVEIPTNELKALFFVKDFDGDPDYVERKEFHASAPPIGRPIRVEFNDGEVLVGTTTGYQAGRPGFFLIPADPDWNNERCYIVAAATRDVRFL